MRRYETIYIMKPNSGDEVITAMLDRVSAIIDNDGGTILKIDKWGLKKLSYLVKKETQGYYVYIDYAGQPATVNEIERIFKIDDQVIKYLTVKLADFCDPEAILAEISTEEAKSEQADVDADSVEDAADADADDPADDTESEDE